MIQAIRLHRPGGPEALVPEPIELSDPGPGMVRVRHSAIGVNYVDIYHRAGLYPLPSLPAIPGVEGAGIVEAVGPDVENVRPGDRVAYAGLPAGSYAVARLIAADRLISLPDTIPERTAAALMLRGITAHMLLHRVYRVRPGDTLLVHAAAGGLGLILTQWAKRLGAVVIGTVGDRGKAALAQSHGLDHAILYRKRDFVAEVRTLTGGRGVDAAFDGIGGEILLRTFDAVRPFGLVVSTGQAGGPVPPLALEQLGPRRSLCLARPSVFAYIADPASYAQAAHDLFAVVADGLTVSVGAEYRLEEAAQAHCDLEARRTMGSILLIP
jgi:NADPH:quinone reductase